MNEIYRKHGAGKGGPDNLRHGVDGQYIVDDLHPAWKQPFGEHADCHKEVKSKELTLPGKIC